jgi:hypothetical protein
MHDARMTGLVCLAGCLAFTAARLAYGPLGGGRPRPCELIPAPDGPADRPDADQQVVYVMDTLPPDEAIRLQGRRERFRVRLDSAVSLVRGYSVAEVVVAGADDLGTVWMQPGESLDDVLEVEARLVVVRHRPVVGANGTLFDGFTELRLVDAARAGRVSR